MQSYIDSLIQYQTDFDRDFVKIYDETQYISELYYWEVKLYKQAISNGKETSPAVHWEVIKKFVGGVSLEVFIAPLNKLKSDGHSILNGIGIITPTDEIRVAHEQIIECLNQRIAITELLYNSFSTFEYLDFTNYNNSYPRDTCYTFDAAITKIATYVNDNK